uniref:Accessory gene regulator B n=1 Tax=virus sp. cti5L29 TaxID=2826813 RepID=A0A8S5R960_9VIRU|nr:MAG TPA: accessory gene regulator B [virus sp. cti5L29]
MNRKVLKTMIILVVVFLSSLYILKIFFPEQFVLSVENEVLIKIGTYIDNHQWAFYMFGILTSFATYWLYLCATCKRWYLKWYECLIVLSVIGISIGLTFWDINVYSAFSCISFVALPCLLGADLKTVSICFTIHSLSQTFTLSIRNIAIYMQNINSLTLYVIGFESFVWLTLLYLYNNYKGDKLWVGNSLHSMERKQALRNAKSQKLTSRLQNLQKKKQSMKNESQTDLRKKKFLKAKLAIRDFIIDELWIYVIIIGSVLLCSWLFNKWIEGAMVIVAHLAIRRVFDKQYHCNTTAQCIVLTSVLIWFAIPSTANISASLLSSIPLAFLICFFGYLAQDRIDLLVEKKKRTELTLNNCTHDDIIEICNELGYNKDKQDLAIMFFENKMSNKEVWKVLCETQRNIEWDTVKKYKYRISKDFKKIIQEREK